MDIEFGLLEHLLKSPSKDFLHQILIEAFNQREQSKINENILRQYNEPLEIDVKTAEQLIQELGKLIKKLLFDSLTELAQIQSVFAPSSLPENLKNLLSKLLAEKLAFFKQRLLNEEAILPKLVDFDWRVDIKMNSNLAMGDESERSGQQTCILQLKPETESATNSVHEITPPRSNRATNRSNSSKPILDIAEIIMQQLRRRSQKELGLLSFLARPYPSDKCGSNGLPLTPNSIRIYGKFQSLKTLISPYLCRYVDIQRGPNERLFVIAENYSLNLDMLLNDTYIYNLIILSGLLTKWIHQLLSGFLTLSEHQITNRFVHLKYICVTPEGNIKLSNYGLFHMTEYGYCVDFSVINWVTIAPECYALEAAYDSKHSLEQAANEELANVELNSPKSDVWALGAILFQFVFGLASHTESSHQHLSQLLAPGRIVSLGIELLASPDPVDGYSHMLALYEIDEKRRAQVEAKTKPVVIELIKRCLTVDPVKRPNFRQLIEFFEKECGSKLLEDCAAITKNEDCWDGVRWKLFSNKVRSVHLSDMIDEEEDTNEKERPKEGELEEEEDHLWRRGVNEIYYLWKLAAGDCLITLKQNGRLSTKLTPIHKLNIYTTVRDGFEHGKQVNDEILFDDTIVPLSLSQLRARLSSVKLDSYYPLFEMSSSSEAGEKSASGKNQEQHKRYNSSHLPDIESMQKQPLNIREGDLAYQFHRVVVFARLLASYPYKKDHLYKECRIDIPPIYRDLAWCALLNVPFNSTDVYFKINKEVITSTDRQIDVDIPRCHQYDYLMASPQAHIKLKRILKAWVLSNPNLVYWQGLDSLCAPFLYLNFNDEARAFACLTSFVNKYATRFFLKDNSAVIHEYLAKFAHLIAFHDPELAVHFDSIEFRPDLYAIPWFLTMFAHIFPLAKIFHLWDTLLLGSSSFPLCIGVAILKQLRSILLGSDFNECILLFSELPEINIAKCVTDSIELFCNTPSSCMYREHADSATSMSSSFSDETTDLAEISASNNDLLDIGPIQLEQMRAELSPRISGADIVTLGVSKLCILDIRPQSEYQQMSIASSRNVPFDAINFAKFEVLVSSGTQLPSANESDSTSLLLYLLQTSRNLVKVITANDSLEHQAVELANYLVRKHKFTKVQNVQEFVNESPKVEQINLELTKQTLNTMIDGFNRIKEQLNVIALAE